MTDSGQSMIELPKSIRVGYRTYIVEAWPAIEASGEGRFGEHSPLSGVIRVRDDLDPVEKANTLLHEVLHAAHFVGGIQGGNKSEEDTVIILANQLAQIWRDNPDWVAFMSAALNPKGAANR